MPVATSSSSLTLTSPSSFNNNNNNNNSNSSGNSGNVISDLSVIQQIQFIQSESTGESLEDYFLTINKKLNKQHYNNNNKRKSLINNNTQNTLQNNNQQQPSSPTSVNNHTNNSVNGNGNLGTTTTAAATVDNKSEKQQNEGTITTSGKKLSKSFLKVVSKIGNTIKNNTTTIVNTIDNVTNNLQNNLQNTQQTNNTQQSNNNNTQNNLLTTPRGSDAHHHEENHEKNHENTQNKKIQNLSINDTIQLMIIFDYKLFTILEDETIDIYFSLYSFNESRFITESIVISSNSGLNRLAMFRDVSANYFLRDEIFLVGRAFRKITTNISATGAGTGNGNGNGSGNTFECEIRKPLAVCSVPFDAESLTNLANGQSITKMVDFHEKSQEKKFTMLHAVIASSILGKKLSSKPIKEIMPEYNLNVSENNNLQQKNNSKNTKIGSVNTTLYSYSSIGNVSKILQNQLQINLLFFKGEFESIEIPYLSRLSFVKPLNWHVPSLVNMSQQINCDNQLNLMNFNRCDIYPSLDRATFDSKYIKTPLIVIKLFEITNEITKEGKFLPLFTKQVGGWKDQRFVNKNTQNTLQNNLENVYFYTNYIFTKKTNPKFFENFVIDGKDKNLENCYLFFYIYNLQQNSLQNSLQLEEDCPKMVGFYKLINKEGIFKRQNMITIPLYRNIDCKVINHNFNFLQNLENLKITKIEKNNLKISLTFFIEKYPHLEFLQNFIFYKKNENILQLLQKVKNELTFKDCIVHSISIFRTIFTILEEFIENEEISKMAIDLFFYIIVNFFSKNGEVFFEKIIYNISINETVYKIMLNYLNEKFSEFLENLQKNQQNITKFSQQAIQSFSLVMILLKKRHVTNLTTMSQVESSLLSSGTWSRLSHGDNKQKSNFGFYDLSQGLTRQLSQQFVTKNENYFYNLIPKIISIFNLQSELPYLSIVKGNLLKAMTISVFDIFYDLLSEEKFTKFVKSVLEIILKFNLNEKFLVLNNILKCKCFTMKNFTNFISEIILQIVIPNILENIVKDTKNYLPILLQISNLFENLIIKKKEKILKILFENLFQFLPILKNINFNLINDCKIYLKEINFINFYLQKPKEEILPEEFEILKIKQKVPYELYFNTNLEIRFKIYTFYYFILFWLDFGDLELFNHLKELFIVKSIDNGEVITASGKSHEKSHMSQKQHLITKEEMTSHMIHALLNCEFEHFSEGINPLVSEYEIFRTFHRKRMSELFTILPKIENLKNIDLFLEICCLGFCSTILEMDVRIKLFNYFVNFYNLKCKNNNLQSLQKLIENLFLIFNNTSQDHKILIEISNFIVKDLFTKNFTKLNIEIFVKLFEKCQHLNLIEKYFIQPLIIQYENNNDYKDFLEQLASHCKLLQNMSQQQTNQNNITKKNVTTDNPENSKNNSSNSSTNNSGSATTKKKKKNIVMNRYEVLKRVGKGGFGSVFKVCDLESEDKKILALKILPKEEGNEFEFLQMAKLNHKNILPVFEFFETKIGNFSKWCFTMPFLEMGDFQSYLLSLKNNLNLFSIVNFMKQMLESLQYIHERNVFHRDIKPENFLMKNCNEIMLSDFGLSKQLENHDNNHDNGHDTSHVMNTKITNEQMVGTELFKSPELFLNEPLKDISKTDIYSLGCVFYIMVTRDFQTVVRISILSNGGMEIRQRLQLMMKSINLIENLEENLENMEDTNKEIVEEEEIVKMVIDLIMEMLNKDPLKRPSAKMALGQLEKVLEKFKFLKD